MLEIFEQNDYSSIRDIAQYTDFWYNYQPILISGTRQKIHSDDELASAINFEVNQDEYTDEALNWRQQLYTMATKTLSPKKLYAAKKILFGNEDGVRPTINYGEMPLIQRSIIRWSDFKNLPPPDLSKTVHTYNPMSSLSLASNYDGKYATVAFGPIFLRDGLVAQAPDFASLINLCWYRYFAGFFQVYYLTEPFYGLSNYAPGHFLADDLPKDEPSTSLSVPTGGNLTIGYTMSEPPLLIKAPFSEWVEVRTQLMLNTYRPSQDQDVSFAYYQSETPLLSYPYLKFDSAETQNVVTHSDFPEWGGRKDVILKLADGYVIPDFDYPAAGYTIAHDSGRMAINASVINQKLVSGALHYSRVHSRTIHGYQMWRSRIIDNYPNMTPTQTKYKPETAWFGYEFDGYEFFEIVDYAGGPSLEVETQDYLEPTAGIMEYVISARQKERLPVIRDNQLKATSGDTYSAITFDLINYVEPNVSDATYREFKKMYPKGSFHDLLKLMRDVIYHNSFMSVAQLNDIGVLRKKYDDLANRYVNYPLSTYIAQNIKVEDLVKARGLEEGYVSKSIPNTLPDVVPGVEKAEQEPLSERINKRVLAVFEEHKAELEPLISFLVKGGKPMWWNDYDINDVAFHTLTTISSLATSFQLTKFYSKYGDRLPMLYFFIMLENYGRHISSRYGFVLDDAFIDSLHGKFKSKIKQYLTFAATLKSKRFLTPAIGTVFVSLFTEDRVSKIVPVVNRRLQELNASYKEITEKFEFYRQTIRIYLHRYYFKTDKTTTAINILGRPETPGEFGLNSWRYNGMDVFGTIVSNNYHQTIQRLMVDSLLEYSTSLTVINYGYSGSGKSTIANGLGKSPGLLPIFLKSYKDVPSGSYFSIYEIHANQDSARGTLKKYAEKASIDEWQRYYDQSNREKIVASTEFNATSSRSHMIYRFYSEKSSFVLVDMAGSEPLAETVQGSRFINTSNHNFFQYMVSLRDGTSIAGNDVFVRFLKDLPGPRRIVLNFVIGPNKDHALHMATKIRRLA